MKVKVQVTPPGRNFSFRAGSNLRAALIAAGVPLDSPCGGQGTCLKCKVQLSGITNQFTVLEQEKLSTEELMTIQKAGLL